MTVWIGRSFCAVTALFLLPSPLTSHYSAPPTVCAQEGPVTAPQHRGRRLPCRAKRPQQSGQRGSPTPSRAHATMPFLLTPGARAVPSPSTLSRLLLPLHLQITNGRHNHQHGHVPASPLLYPRLRNRRSRFFAASSSSSSPQVRLASPPAAPNIIKSILSCGQMFNEMPLRRRCIWLMVLCCLFVCVADGGACRRRRWLL
jgi:hypothetical protein